MVKVLYIDLERNRFFIVSDALENHRVDKNKITILSLYCNFLGIPELNLSKK